MIECPYSNCVTALSVTRDEVSIGNRIYWTLTLVTTSNYDSLTQLHTQKINVTTAHLKSSPASLAVAWQQLPTANVRLPLGSRSFPGFSCQLLNNSKSKIKFKESAQLSLYSDCLQAGRLRGRSSSPGGGKNFHFPMSARPSLGSIEPPIQWIPGSFASAGKAAGAWSWPLTSNWYWGQENIFMA
jgi:hypothetical protein